MSLGLGLPSAVPWGSKCIFHGVVEKLEKKPAMVPEREKAFPK